MQNSQDTKSSFKNDGNPKSSDIDSNDKQTPNVDIGAGSSDIHGDTSGDTEMLAIAEEPGYRVFQEKP